MNIKVYIRGWIQKRERYIYKLAKAREKKSGDLGN